MRTDARWMRWGLPTGSRSNDTICDIMIDHRHKTNTRHRQLYILFRQQSICVAQSKDWKTTWPRIAIGKRIFESLCSYMKVPLDVADAVESMFQHGTNMQSMIVHQPPRRCTFGSKCQDVHSRTVPQLHWTVDYTTTTKRTTTRTTKWTRITKWSEPPGMRSFCFTTSMVSWSSCCYVHSMKVGLSLTWLSLITIQ